MENRLKSFRERAGLSQAALAERSGISRQALNGIEAGKQTPSVAIALALAHALGARVEDLFSLAGSAAFEVDFAEDAIHASRAALGRVDGRLVAHPMQAGILGGADARVLEMASGVGRVELFGRLDEVDKNVLIAGCAPVLELLEGQISERFLGARMRWIHASSGHALRLLELGLVHVAGIHLADESSTTNHSEIIRERFSDEMVLVNLVTWREGLIVPAGNPLGLSATDLVRPDLRVAWREEGAGARKMLERAFDACGVEEERLPDGPVARGHMDVARWIHMGGADVGVAIESAALAFGLEFIPLSVERFDLVLPRARAEQRHVARVLEQIDSRRFSLEVDAIGGYETLHTGHAFTVEPAA